LVQFGKLNQRVVIQSETTTGDGAGGFSVVWGNDVSRWANVQPLTGRERFAAMQMGYQADFKVYFRYEANLVSVANRIQANSKNLYVVDVRDPLLSNKHLECICSYKKPETK